MLLKFKICYKINFSGYSKLQNKKYNRYVNNIIYIALKLVRGETYKN